MMVDTLQQTQQLFLAGGIQRGPPQLAKTSLSLFEAPTRSQTGEREPVHCWGVNRLVKNRKNTQVCAKKHKHMVCAYFIPDPPPPIREQS